MNSPVRILYVHHGSGQGGAANSLLYLLKNLDRTRFAPRVACNFEFPMAREFFTQHGFEAIHVPIAPFVHTMKTWNLMAPKGMAKFIRWLVTEQQAARAAFDRLLVTSRPDLVHLNGLSVLPLAPVAKARNTFVVQHVRESINEGYFGLRKRWLRTLADQNVDHIIYICEDNKDRLKESTAPSSVIYNPIEFDKFKMTASSPIRRRLGLPNEYGVLFFPGGSFFDIKGITHFLDALAITRKRFPSACAIIPGLDRKPHPRDEIRRAIERKIDAHNLHSAIFRLPFTADVEEYYAACDIVVAPFIRPHFSRAVIEAGAMGRPVIGSRIGGITEVLQDGKTGLLATPGDEVDLAQKICWMFENVERAFDMGAIGRTIALRRFNAIDHACQVMDIYDTVLNRRGGAQ
jgi:glycosyltransferase involved in cell wall biosynthesis